MESFLMSQGDDVWFIIESGWSYPAKTTHAADGTPKVEMKPRSEWTQEEKALFLANAKARNSIINGVDEVQY